MIWTARELGRDDPPVQKSPGKGLFIAYVVFAIAMALMMFMSASMKITLNPGAVQVIHDVVGVPLVYFPFLAGCEVAGGLGLLVGILRPRIGVAAGIGLVLYFVGAIVGHIRVGDWAGLKSPITPFIIAVVVLTLRLMSARRATSVTSATSA
jgi:hypothetical protein